jgi:hypothetical protein
MIVVVAGVILLALAVYLLFVRNKEALDPAAPKPPVAGQPPAAGQQPQGPAAGTTPRTYQVATGTPSSYSNIYQQRDAAAGIPAVQNTDNYKYDPLNNNATVTNTPSNMNYGGNTMNQGGTNQGGVSQGGANQAVNNMPLEEPAPYNSAVFIKI